MGPVAELWFRAFRWLERHDNLKRFFETTHAIKLASAPHHMLLERQMIQEYGRGFKHNHTGTLEVDGVRFKLQDPFLDYLPAVVTGLNYEPAVTKHLKHLAQYRNLCFMDVGAYMGFFTAYVGVINPRCKIHSFEPNADFFRVLKENVRINRINANLYKLALSDSTGKVPFAGRSMGLEPGFEPQTVQTVPFDDLNKRLRIKPNVVKIDVHGAEGKVLQGMTRALERNIKHLYCEVHNENLMIDYKVTDVIDMLINSGFELFEMEMYRRSEAGCLVKLTGERIKEFIDTRHWSRIHRMEQRMIYASKSPELLGDTDRGDEANQSG